MQKTKKKARKLTKNEQSNFLSYVRKYYSEIDENNRKGEITLLCPFCGGGSKHLNTLSVNYEKGVVRCWRATCGFKGSAKTLIAEHLKIPPEEAKKVLSGESKSPMQLKSDLDFVEESIYDRYNDFIDFDADFYVKEY